MAKEHSFTDSKGLRWTACCECNKGGNGFAVDKCACGWQVKRWNHSGCFMGESIQAMRWPGMGLDSVEITPRSST